MPNRIIEGKDIRTAFFEWRWLDFLWVARDPVDDKRRWVIREAAGFTGQWELCYVQDTIPYRQALDTQPIRLAWLAVSKRIQQIAEIRYKYGELYSSEDMLVRCQHFLDDLSRKLSLKEGSVDVAPNTKSDVDQEVGVPPAGNSGN